METAFIVLLLAFVIFTFFAVAAVIIAYSAGHALATQSIKATCEATLTAFVDDMASDAGDLGGPCDCEVCQPTHADTCECPECCEIPEMPASSAKSNYTPSRN